MDIGKEQTVHQTRNLEGQQASVRCLTLLSKLKQQWDSNSRYNTGKIDDPKSRWGCEGTESSVLVRAN